MDCRAQLATLAYEELDKGDYLMAIKILTTRIKLGPDSHEAYLERSECYYKVGDYQASLNDANAAIRLNPADYNSHYQKGLASLGLYSTGSRSEVDEPKLAQAVASFKKAIELRAKQDDSKLSDIYRMLRAATYEYDAARRNTNHQARNETVITQNRNQTGAIATGSTTSNNLSVNTTTDRQNAKPGPSSNLQTPVAPVGIFMESGNNLVANNRSNQPISSNSSQMLHGASTPTNRVVAPAGHTSINHMSSVNLPHHISAMNANSSQLSADLLHGNLPSGSQHVDQSKAAQFEWNIRRSERIFLHHSNEPGQTGPQYGLLPPTNVGHAPRSKTNSNPSSITSARSATKRLHDGSELQPYQPNKLARSKDGTSSHVESDVDVDDSYNNKTVSNTNSSLSQSAATCSTADSADSRKRVMIAPSSSMPATSQQGPPPSTSKDDSYSSKYKRLRRDRERARRGTSKLCTIKLSDLEELQKPTNCSSDKRFMRVIAPIDGWLYSGQLSVDDNCDNAGAQQYVVKLDGDATGGSYLFSQETVLNDVIKEVRVKTVSELRKGARICCYWSRQYKCLSTGVVTSRTFEATKSLVSVKYDNGDLSALPLDDLRLLPPDYPKYMSNCDPLLLARNGDGAHVSVTMPAINDSDASRFIVESKPTISVPTDNTNENGVSTSSDIETSSQITPDLITQAQAIDNNANVSDSMDSTLLEESDQGNEMFDEKDDTELSGGEVDDEDDATTIPPTDEVIDFITSDITLKLQNTNQHDSTNLVERASITTKDNINITTSTQLNANNSRASSEENNYGIEYCPWTFDGPPKRIKRHGRTYRDSYTRIRRGNEIIQVGDSAELMPRDESILPFIARIEGFWANSRGEMRVKVRWYYRLVETEGEPYELKDGENALFETQHFDENDVQSIYRSTKILPWTDYCQNNLGHVNKNNDNTPKIFYLAGYYDPVRRSKHLRSDVKEAQ